MLGILARQGRYDGGPYWADDNVTAVLPTRAREDGNRDLTLVSLSGRPSETLDSLAPNESFGTYTLSPRGELVVYSKGVEPSFDGYYVDLRETGSRRPARLPGEG